MYFTCASGQHRLNMAHCKWSTQRERSLTFMNLPRTCYYRFNCKTVLQLVDATLTKNIIFLNSIIDISFPVGIWMARRFIHCKDDWHLGWTRVFSTVDLPRTRYDNWKSFWCQKKVMDRQRFSFWIDVNDLKPFFHLNWCYVCALRLTITVISSYPIVE